jgi:hypothetical protein
MQSYVSKASGGFLAAALLSLTTAGTVRADDVTDWVETLSAYAAPINPLVASRDGAIMSTAVFDAVNGIERRYAPFYVTATAPRGASKRAAAVQAAYVTLLARYPAKSSDLAAKRTASLAAIPDGESKERGVAWGQYVADAILVSRSNDGFTPNPPPYLGSTDIGKWRPTAPGFAPGAVPQFATMTPWGIQSPDQFLPPGPPALGSAQYLADYEEVKAFGRIDSAVRSLEQKEIAEFWASARPATQWNRAAIKLALASGNELSDNARLFAMLNAAIADSLIACWNAKYHYSFWRPETAIQNGDFDGVDATIGDAAWKPLQPSPPYPDYPSGLCSASSAPSTVLESFFGAGTPFELESTTMPGWVRNYPNFAASRAEVVDARVWLGIHFRTTDKDGITLGQSVGNYVLVNKMQRLHGEGE